MSSAKKLQEDSFIRGYDEYLDIWQPNIGDEHRLMREPNNKVDSNAGAVVSKYSRKNVVLRKSVQNVKHLEHMSSNVCLHPNDMSADFQVIGHVPKLMAIFKSSSNPCEFKFSLESTFFS